MIRNLLVFAILARNLQMMAPFIDSDDKWEVLDGFRSGFQVPGDINIGK